MYERLNLCQRIEMLAKDECVEAAVVTNLTWGDNDGCPTKVPEDKLGQVVSWAEAKYWLDSDIELGYGSSQEPYYDVTAWTPSKVIYTTSYDGKLVVESQPRNPVPQEVATPV